MHGESRLPREGYHGGGALAERSLDLGWPYLLAERTCGAHPLCADRVTDAVVPEAADRELVCRQGQRPPQLRRPGDVAGHGQALA